MTWKNLPKKILDAAGVEEDIDGGAIVPYKNPQGLMHNRRVFNPDGSCYWETPGRPLLPFGLETLGRSKDLFITEGESDALALRSYYSDVVGIPGAATWRSTWLVYFANYDRVYVVGDGDAPGHQMMDTIWRADSRVRSVVLPWGEDVRSIMQSDAVTMFPEYVAESERRWIMYYAFLDASSLSDYQHRVSNHYYTSTEPK